MINPMGRTDARRPVGRVADFCPLCRGFRPFRLLAIENVRTVFTLRVGPRVAVGYARLCESCGLSSDAKPEAYTSVSQDFDEDLDALIARTNPEIRRNWASRMMLEDRVRARKLAPGERTTLLREPFDMADAVLARRNREGTLDLPSRLGCLGTVALPIVVLALVPLAWSPPGEALEWVAIALGGGSLAVAFLAITTDGRRHARRDILPRLVEAVRPLDPSVDELDDIFASLREAKSPLADFLRPRDVSNALMERWE